MDKLKDELIDASVRVYDNIHLSVDLYGNIIEGNEIRKYCYTHCTLKCYKIGEDAGEIHQLIYGFFYHIYRRHVRYEKKSYYIDLSLLL